MNQSVVCETEFFVESKTGAYCYAYVLKPSKQKPVTYSNFQNGFLIKRAIKLNGLQTVSIKCQTLSNISYKTTHVCFRFRE